ncbi:thioredoxin family protein [Flavobacteriaceae bacterium SZ-1-7]|uniref:thioredoxin family protein n=1 Tax=Tamlana sedimenti TaxID=3134126 RepID=UPI0031297F59
MKKQIIVFILFFVGLTTAFAQDWNTNFALAKEKATLENKPIILVFQGSDWCAPCIKLDREIWSTDEFKAYSKAHFVMLKADFPRKKQNALSKTQAKENATLAETYNKNGIFPFVVVLDNKGKVMGQTGYKKTTPKLFIDELNAFLN